MRKSAGVYLLVLFSVFANKAIGQYFEKKDIVINTLLIDIRSRLNIGVEYFLPFKNKERWDETNRFSLALNAGALSAVVAGQALSGYNWSVKASCYSQLALPRRWNEYVGLTFGHGVIHNATRGADKTMLFFGLSMGVHPLIAKRIAIKISYDVGYLQNGLPWMFDDEIYPHSGFAFFCRTWVWVFGFSRDLRYDHPALKPCT